MYSRGQSILRSSAILIVAVATATGSAFSQSKTTEKTPPSKTGKPPADVPKKVDVVPEADDTDIQSRLTRILLATGWYEDVQVRVDEGIVYLSHDDLENHRSRRFITELHHRARHEGAVGKRDRDKNRRRGRSRAGQTFDRNLRRPCCHRIRDDWLGVLTLRRTR